MGKTSTASKRKYNEKKYDRISVTVPRPMKGVIKAFAEKRGQSVNSMISELLKKEMGDFTAESSGKTEDPLS